MLSRSSSLLLLAWLGLSLSLASAYHHRNFEQVRVVSHSKASAALLEEQTAIPNNDEASKKTHLVSHAKEDDARNTNGLVSEAVPMLPERNEAYDQAIFYDQGIHTLGHATGAPGAEEGEQHELNRREPLHDAMEAHDSMAHAVFDTQGTPGLDHSFDKEDMQLHANPPSASAHHGHSAPAPAVPAAAPATPAAPPAATPSKKQSHQVQGQFPGADAPPSDATLNSDYAAGELSEMSEETEAAAAEEDAEHAANHSKLRLTTKKWTSCADKCNGEGEITDALKAGKKTPRCCVDLIYDTVTYVDRLLSRNKITYWTMKGTLLGVVREKGVIPHDYDIDIGVLFRDLNKIASLRQIIDQDGYVLLQAPWSGYNNMNFVIVKKTEAVKKYFKKNPVKDGKLPKFTKGLRERSVSAELMVFEEMNGMLIQVLCTHPHPENPHLYAGNMNRDQIWKEYLQDEKAYQARAASETDGWLKYANQKDLPWVNYHKKFKKNMAPNCERTAPSSFKYEAPAAMVLPPKRARYFSTTLAVPNDPHGYCTRYFGKDYMTPKRRYGL